MYVKKSKTRNGRYFLSYVQGYRDEFKKPRQKTVENIGWLDELEKEYDDPIAHFKEIAKARNSEEINKLLINHLNTIEIEENSVNKNLGYCVLKKLYKELGLEELLKDVKANSKIKYNLNDIFSMLVYMRIIKPGSKKNSYENRNMLFENSDYSLDDVYRSLTLLNPLKKEIQKVMWENTKETYERDTSTAYYDCTNYYFEIEYNDADVYKLDADGNPILDNKGNKIITEKGLRKRGPEKNHRPDPIVEMGLLMDASGIPLSYDIFPGNESEKLSLIPIFNRTKNDFNLQRTIIVADRGLNTSDNIIKIAGLTLEQSIKMNGYVYGQSVRGADAEFKSWVLDGNYITDTIEENNNKIIFKHKSRIYPKKMNVKRTDKNKTKGGNDKIETILVDQKQMVYYSQKYADKQKRDREMVISRAKDLIKHPTKYNKATSYGISGYVNNLAFIKKTGEVADGLDLSLNQDKIDEEAKYDGYYSIVTSEENKTDIEIRNIYRGLAKIEETFKVTKSGLESRPVWVSRNDHIESHFLICFVSLVIVRLLEKRLNNEYSFKQIINTIRNYTSTNLEHDIYVQNFKNNIITEFEKEFNIDLSKKYLTLSKIKKILK